MTEDELAERLARLRAPAHAVLGLTELLVHTGEGDQELLAALATAAGELTTVLDDLLAPVPAVPAHPAAAPTATAMVLVVDDSPVNQLLTTTQLHKLGFAATCASNGLEAMELLGQLTPAAVLMDWHMQGLDGLETTRRIRQWEVAEGRVAVPIIAVTARAMTGDRERCLEAGMNDFLPKPVSIRDLEATLRRWTVAAN